MCEDSLRHSRGSARMTEPTGLAGPAAPHRNRRRGISLHPNRAILLAAAALAAGTAPALAAATTERVSVSSKGAQGNQASLLPAISASGRFVAFASDATNLVRGDTNRRGDVFVHDRKTGTTERVSLSSTGEQGKGGKGGLGSEILGVAIAEGGRFVAFSSAATNLVQGDTNHGECGFGICGFDVFVRDRKLGTTERVSVSSSGAESNGPSTSPSISADGRFVAFSSVTSTLVAGALGANVYVRDRKSGTTELASVSSSGAHGDDDSLLSSISANGRFVAFQSNATNLASGDTNGVGDVFVHDRKTGTTERVSVATGGTQGDKDSGVYGMALSANGRFVAFDSFATNLVSGDTNKAVDVFVYTR
jgi:Tol biopolymer transport system component